MAKSDPTKWLERAAHIRGLGRGVNDQRMAPMFEKLATRLEAIAIAKAEEQMKAKEGSGNTETPRDKAVRRRGKSGGEANTSTRSDEYVEDKTPKAERRPDRRSRARS